MASIATELGQNHKELSLTDGLTGEKTLLSTWWALVGTGPHNLLRIVVLEYYIWTSLKWFY